MTLDLLVAIAAYAFVTTITPGPNNAMLLASGLTFGFWRTGPHLLGIAVGFAGMVAAVGFGAGELFKVIPHLHDILRVVATLYLLYLAWKIAHSTPLEGASSEAASDRKPFSFLQAAAFQWVNPKAWVMAIGAISTYALPEAFSVSVIVIALSFLIVGSPCIACWAAFGSLMRRLMSDPRRVRQINFGMAALLVASALYPLIAAMG
jgi:threonine/homoserine/homoserine lactone efflux protein